ncbi:MAG: hypothetical protein V3U92_05140 [Cellulophaga sp.]
MGIFDFLNQKNNKSKGEHHIPDKKKSTSFFNSYNPKNDPYHSCNNTISHNKEFLAAMSVNWENAKAYKRIDILEKGIPETLAKVDELKKLKLHWKTNPNTTDQNVIDKNIRYYDMAISSFLTTIHQAKLAIKEAQICLKYHNIESTTIISNGKKKLL